MNKLIREAKTFAAFLPVCLGIFPAALHYALDDTEKSSLGEMYEELFSDLTEKRDPLVWSAVLSPYFVFLVLRRLKPRG